MPEDEVWLEEGIALRRMGRYGQAALALEKAIAINPANASAWRNRA